MKTLFIIMLTVLLMSTVCSAQQTKETITFQFNGIWLGSTGTHDINTKLSDFKSWNYNATVTTGVTFMEKLSITAQYNYPYPLVEKEGKSSFLLLGVSYRLLF